jgi:HAD superfamily hydrolase (TIGR01509 family)
MKREICFTWLNAPLACAIDSVRMKQYQAIIFDMDGVIIDSEPLHEIAYRELFNEIGYGEIHGINFDDYLGRTDKALIEDFIARHNPSYTVEMLSDLKRDRFLKIMRREEPIFEDLPQLVELVSKRYRLAVASGSLHPVIDAVLALKNLRQYFEITVSSSDVPNGKPAPDIFLHTAKLLNVAPANCCVIEDSGPGVCAARAAGMDVIAITNSLPREKLCEATWVVDDYEEIDEMLLRKVR